LLIGGLGDFGMLGASPISKHRDHKIKNSQGIADWGIFRFCDLGCVSNPEISKSPNLKIPKSQNPE
jgi:hypothetical protein